MIDFRDIKKMAIFLFFSKQKYIFASNTYLLLNKKYKI